MDVVAKCSAERVVIGRRRGGRSLMTALVRSFLPAALCLAITACGAQTESAEASAEPVVLQTSMKNVVKPQTEVVLNLLIAALTEPPDPQVDPSKLADGDWAIMETAATALRDEAIALHDRPIQVVAQPGDTLFGEVEQGTHDAAEVQAFIDADPEDFKADADALRVKAEEWLTAIDARDTATMWRIALDVDPVCVQCHDVFWSGEPEHHDDDLEDH